MQDPILGGFKGSQERKWRSTADASMIHPREIARCTEVGIQFVTMEGSLSDQLNRPPGLLNVEVSVMRLHGVLKGLAEVLQTITQNLTTMERHETISV